MGLAFLNNSGFNSYIIRSSKICSFLTWLANSEVTTCRWSVTKFHLSLMQRWVHSLPLSLSLSLSVYMQASHFALPFPVINECRPGFSHRMIFCSHGIILTHLCHIVGVICVGLVLFMVLLKNMNHNCDVHVNTCYFLNIIMSFFQKASNDF